MTWNLPEVFMYQGQPIAWGAMGDGPPVILMHGTPFSSVEWYRVAPWLARHRRVFYYDMLGYGRSAKPDADVSRGMQNGLFAALVDHWQLEQPDVVAHDFGGSTALRAHLIDKLDYRSLVLIDPVAISPQGSALSQAAKAHEAVFASLPESIHEAILRSYIDATAGKKLDDDAMQRYLAPWMGKEGQQAFWRQIAQMDDRYTEEVEWHYGDIRCPVQLLWGADDDMVPVTDGEELAKRIGQGPLSLVPNAKHLMQEDAPEAIIACVLDFWAKQGRL